MGKKRKICRRACVQCRTSHSCCDETRPCKRCLEMGITCEDLPTKKRGRKRKFSGNSQFAPVDSANPQAGASMGENFEDDDEEEEDQQEEAFNQIVVAQQPLKKKSPSSPVTFYQYDPQQKQISYANTNELTIPQTSSTPFVFSSADQQQIPVRYSQMPASPHFDNMPMLHRFGITTSTPQTPSDFSMACIPITTTSTQQSLMQHQPNFASLGTSAGQNAPTRFPEGMFATNYNFLPTQNVNVNAQDVHSENVNFGLASVPMPYMQNHKHFVQLPNNLNVNLVSSDVGHLSSLNQYAYVQSNSGDERIILNPIIDANRVDPTQLHFSSIDHNQSTNEQFNNLVSSSNLSTSQNYQNLSKIFIKPEKITRSKEIQQEQIDEARKNEARALFFSSNSGDDSEDEPEERQTPGENDYNNNPHIETKLQTSSFGDGVGFSLNFTPNQSQFSSQLSSIKLGGGFHTTPTTSSLQLLTGLSPVDTSFVPSNDLALKVPSVVSMNNNELVEGKKKSSHDEVVFSAIRNEEYEVLKSLNTYILYRLVNPKKKDGDKKGETAGSSSGGLAGGVGDEKQDDISVSTFGTADPSLHIKFAIRYDFYYKMIEFLYKVKAFKSILNVYNRVFDENLLKYFRINVEKINLYFTKYVEKKNDPTLDLSNPKTFYSEKQKDVKQVYQEVVKQSFLDQMHQFLKKKMDISRKTYVKCQDCQRNNSNKAIFNDDQILEMVDKCADPIHEVTMLDNFNENDLNNVFLFQELQRNLFFIEEFSKGCSDIGVIFFRTESGLIILANSYAKEAVGWDFMKKKPLVWMELFDVKRIPAKFLDIIDINVYSNHSTLTYSFEKRLIFKNAKTGDLVPILSQITSWCLHNTSCLIFRTESDVEKENTPMTTNEDWKNLTQQIFFRLKKSKF